MTLVLDTSVLVAYLNKDEPRHATAKAILHRAFRGEWGQPVTLHDVLDEGLTLLQRRGAPRALCRAYADLMLPGQPRPPLTLRSATPEQVERAVALFLQRFDRKLSMTDCLLATVATDLGAPVASFDDGFDGVVARIQAA